LERAGPLLVIRPGRVLAVEVSVAAAHVVVGVVLGVSCVIYGLIALIS
jgi:hypothetical protein